jgi:hypothetical protein
MSMNTQPNPKLSDWKLLTKIFRTVRKENPTGNKFYDDLVLTKKMRVYYPISNEEVAKLNASEPVSVKDRNITAVLNELGFSTVDLDNNSGTMEGDKNVRKLGRVFTASKLKKYEEALKKRNNSASSAGGYVIVVSAHPMDVVTASFNRNWTSCMRFTRAYSHDLIANIITKDRYAMAAYLCRANDRSIKRPLGRVFLNGYTQRNDDSTYSNWERRYIEKNKNIQFYESGYSIPNTLARQVGILPKKSGAVFNMSKSSYGRFPLTMRAILSDKVVKEINGRKNKTLDGSYTETTLYIDRNDFEIQALHTVTAKQKVTTPIDEIKIPTIDNILFDGLVYDNKKHTHASYAYVYVMNPDTGNNVRLGPAERAHIVITTRNTNYALKCLKTLPLKFYQMRQIIIKRPTLLKNAETAKYISSKGPEYKLMVDNHLQKLNTKKETKK